MRKTYKYLFIILLSIFAVSSVFITIETVTSGAEVATLEKNGTKLLLEKGDLESAFVKSYSLKELQEKSLQLGFSKVGELMYVSQGSITASAR